MLNRVLNQLLEAEKDGTLAMEFFDHDPKAHAKRELRRLPNETIRNIFKYIMRHIMLLWVFLFSQRVCWIFIGAKRLYLYTFPLTLIVGIAIIFFFIWMLFKTVQIRCFNTSHLSWLLTYLVLLLSVCGIFYVFFIPQMFLTVGPYLLISNWTFIIISFIFIPIALYIDHHFTNKTPMLHYKYY